MSDKLKSNVESYYNDKSLTEQQQDALSTLITKAQTEEDMQADVQVNTPTKDTQPVDTQPSPWLKRAIRGSIASAALLFVVLLMQMPDSADVQSIATEVAQNHQHQKPLTIQTSSYEQLQGFFSELNFKIQPSSLINTDRWQLLGGRYCSLNGLKAAQLRVLDKQDNSIQTFYQVKNKASHFNSIPNITDNKLPLSINIDGMPVQVWSEGGILYSLTHESKTEKNN